MTWHADLPDDFVALVKTLQEDNKLNAVDEY
jgi:23S rRNA pseudouridine1911/1915/1917 synthase